MTFTAEQIVVLLVACTSSSVLGGVVTAVVNRRKMAADASEVIGRAWSGVVEALEERLRVAEGQIVGLESKLATERDRNDELWRLVGALRAEKDQLVEELKTERALSKRLGQKIGFLEDRLKALEPQAVKAS